MIFRLGHERGFLARNQRGPYVANKFPLFHAAIGAVAPSAIGIPNQYGVWNQVFSAYHADNLGAALDLAEQLGIGPQGEYGPFLAMLDAEVAAGLDSNIYQLAPALEFEVDEQFLPEPGLGVAISVMREAVPLAAQALPEPALPLLISALVPETQLPSLAFSKGYYVVKKEKGKLCLPADSFDEPERLGRRLRRGFAYHVGATRTGDTADAWLLEAMTTLVDAGLRTRHENAWLDEVRMNLILEGCDEPDDLERWQQARWQAALIGFSVFRGHNEAGIAELLDAHLKTNLSTAFAVMRSPTREALQSAWGREMEQMFSRSAH